MGRLRSRPVRRRWDIAWCLRIAAPNMPIGAIFFLNMTRSRKRMGWINWKLQSWKKSNMQLEYYSSILDLVREAWPLAWWRYIWYKKQNQVRYFTWLRSDFGSTETEDRDWRQTGKFWSWYEIKENLKADRDIGEGDGGLRKKRRIPTYSCPVALFTTHPCTLLPF